MYGEPPGARSVCPDFQFGSVSPLTSKEEHGDAGKDQGGALATVAVVDVNHERCEEHVEQNEESERPCPVVGGRWLDDAQRADALNVPDELSKLGAFQSKETPRLQLLSKLRVRPLGDEVCHLLHDGEEGIRRRGVMKGKSTSRYPYESTR